MTEARHPRSRRSWFALVPATLMAVALAGCLQRPATMKVSTKAIDLGGQSNASSFEVKNTARDGLLTAGVRSLDYSISADKDWVSVDPSSGKCSAGQTNTHTVQVDRTRMLVGNNIATISITSNDGPWSILVRADNLQASCTAAPIAPSTPSPASATTGLPTQSVLAWAGGTSQCPGLLATYDLYFGTNSPPPFHHDNGSAKLWDPGVLASATTYFWRIVAKDANGSTISPEWRFTTAAAACTGAPGAVALVAPALGATSVSVNQDLTWSAGESVCPGLTANYEVRFGTSATPPFVRNNGTSKTWDPGVLANGTTYYWQIVATDANGSTAGPIWNFTTVSAACTAGPGAVALVAPALGATSVSVNQDLTWSAGASVCPGLTAIYDVRFGTSATPPFVRNNGTSKTWDPGVLANGTTYYWQIVARDTNGSNAGPIWNFTTIAAACSGAPTAACSPLPAPAATGVNENTDLAWSCGDSPCTGVVPTYDVYFGTNPTPGANERLGNSATKLWVLPKLLRNTTYYWQIVAKDANGSTPGPIWSFKIRV